MSEPKLEPYVVYMNQTPKTLAIDPFCQGDPYYRYQVHQLAIQVIGSGKMIRTALTNLDEVAEDLKLPPDYIPHYLAKSLGAQAKYDKKKPDRERGSISGEYSLQELSDLLARFYQEFVMCPNCRLSELRYASGGKKDLRIRCDSCGWKGGLDGLKKLTNEKFKRYIVNNPPAKPKTGPKGKEDSSTNGVGKTKAASAKEKSKHNGDGWAADTSEEAQKERLQEMVPERLKDMIATEDNAQEKEKTSTERLREFFDAKPASSQVISEIQHLQRENGLGKKEIVKLLFDVLFSDLFNAQNNIQPHREVLAKFVGYDAYCQGMLLAFVEEAFGAMPDPKQKEAFLKQALFLVKNLYDTEIVEEEQILAWYQADDVEQPLRKVVQPFAKWLMEAEEEGSGSEEDTESKPATKKIEEVPKKKEEEEVDLDAEIDAL